ncbi:MAG: hypothetical protein RIR52_1464, partial [Acidobacteriota bacterium]
LTHIAENGDVLGFDILQIGAASSACPNDGEVQFVVEPSPTDICRRPKGEAGRDRLPDELAARGIARGISLTVTHSFASVDLSLNRQDCLVGPIVAGTLILTKL